MAELSYVTIFVAGEDACNFLQAQLTRDIRPLGAENPGPVLAAWCNPKGRVIALMRVSWTPEGYALALPRELADAVVDRLKLFRFRSRVTFTVRPVVAGELGLDDDASDWRLDNLRAGIAEIGTTQSEGFTPHMLNLDLLGAVSLDKGCYPGQEIVARTHYRGATKRRMFRFESSGPVAPGDAVLDDSGKAVGDVVNATGTEILAVVPVAAADSVLRVGDATLNRQPLPYDAAAKP